MSNTSENTKSKKLRPNPVCRAISRLLASLSRRFTSLSSSTSTPLLLPPLPPPPQHPPPTEPEGDVALLLSQSPMDSVPVPPSLSNDAVFPPPATVRASTHSAHSSRPSSSSRPWVRDSDASSIHSESSSCAGRVGPGGGTGGQTGLGSSQGSLQQGEQRVMINPDGTEEVVDEGGEVFKAPGDMECAFSRSPLFLRRCTDSVRLVQSSTTVPNLKARR